MNIVSLGIALVLNYQQAPTFELNNTERKVIIQKFFEQEMPKGTLFKISPLIKGKASVKVERSKHFAIMFSSLMQQLGTTYRYEAGNWTILPKTEK